MWNNFLHHARGKSNNYAPRLCYHSSHFTYVFFQLSLNCANLPSKSQCSWVTWPPRELISNSIPGDFHHHIMLNQCTVPSNHMLLANMFMLLTSIARLYMDRVWRPYNRVQMYIHCTSTSYNTKTPMGFPLHAFIQNHMDFDNSWQLLGHAYCIQVQWGYLFETK